MSSETSASSNINHHHHDDSAVSATSTTTGANETQQQQLLQQGQSHVDAAATKAPTKAPPPPPQSDTHHQQQQLPEASDAPTTENEETQFLIAYLETHFSHQSFLSQHQQIATSHALLDTDLLISLREGKSITYQLPAAIRTKGLTVVIMPTEQCIQREKAKYMKDVLVWWVTDDESHNTLLNQMRATVRQVNEDDDETPSLAKLLYVSCRRFVDSDTLQHYLLELNHMKLLNQFVIDEIQCLESDRFPEYERLALIREVFPDVCMTVLTGVITAKLQHRILNVIRLHDDAICVIEPSYRDNIFYEVLPRYSLQHAVQQMAQAIQSSKYAGESGIIFSMDRQELNLIQAQLQKHGISSAVLDPNDPHIFEHNYEQWISGQQPVAIATQDFRFGVHKSNIRFVFHYSLPASIEEYIQDTNLAGRDDQSSRCTLFLDLSDIERMKYIHSSPRAVEQLKQMALYADNAITPRRVLLEQYCSINAEPTSGPCDNSTRKVENCVECDLSIDVKNFLTCVDKANCVSMSECIDLFRGVASKTLMAQDPCFGEGGHYQPWEGVRLAYLLYIYGYIELEFSNGPNQQIAVVTERGYSFIKNPQSNFKMTEPSMFPAKAKYAKKRTKPTNSQAGKKRKRRRLNQGGNTAQKSQTLASHHFPSLHPLFIQYMYQAYPQLYQNLLLIQNHWMQQQGAANGAPPPPPLAAGTVGPIMLVPPNIGGGGGPLPTLPPRTAGPRTGEQ